MNHPHPTPASLGVTLLTLAVNAAQTGCTPAPPPKMDEREFAAAVTSFATGILDAQMISAAAYSFYAEHHRWPADAAEFRKALDREIAENAARLGLIAEPTPSSSSSVRPSTAPVYSLLCEVGIGKVKPQPNGDLVVEFTTSALDEPIPIHLPLSATTQPSDPGLDQQTTQTLMQRMLERTLSITMDRPKPS
jgi:hypothetical protein